LIIKLPSLSIISGCYFTNNKPWSVAGFLLTEVVVDLGFRHDNTTFNQL
ncbi:uncharacterized protein METZ01_LOCUS212209, partial [marine metagenome]